MGVRARTSLWAATGLFLLGGAAAPQDPEPEPQPERATVAIVVNKKNPTTRLSMGQLHDYFLLEREFWANRKRAELQLPRADSVASQVLLEKVYRMSEKDLEEHWVRQIFRGKLADFPSRVTSPAAAIKLVKANVGAFSAILLEDVTEDVRVLAIDGKLPGDEGYPLTAVVEDTARSP